MDNDLYAHYKQMLTGTILKVQRSSIRREPSTAPQGKKRTSFKQGEMKGLFLTENAAEGVRLIVERPLISWLHPAYVREIYADVAYDYKEHSIFDEFQSMSESSSSIGEANNCISSPPAERLDTTARKSLVSCAIRPTANTRYCFNCLSPITEQIVYCRNRNRTTAHKCQHEYCSEDCRESHYILGHVALCISLWPDSAGNILKMIENSEEPTALFSAYNVLEVMAQVLCKEIAYLIDIEDEAVSLQYAYMHYAYMEPGFQARRTYLDSLKTLPNRIFSNIVGIFEHLVPDISFKNASFLLTRTTLLNPQMFNYLVCVLLTNCYTVDNGKGQEVGAALYSIISCCNHSCAPNAQVIFEDPKNVREATLVLLRPCSKDEELNISYITDLGLPVAERRRELTQWCFACQCSRCLAELRRTSSPLQSSVM